MAPEPSPLAVLLRHMQPELNPGAYVFATVPADAPLAMSKVVATIREPEGLAIVLDEQEAARLGIAGGFRCAWITLRVNSGLEAVGLTAAFSTCLGAAGIACNVVAGAHHDHLFVPYERAEEAIRQLRLLQASAGAGPQ